MTLEPMTLGKVLAIYEDLRPYMQPFKQAAPAPDAAPASAPPMGPPQHATSLTEILDRFDALLLDGYGVLNVGEVPVPGAKGMLHAARQHGVEVLVLTNGASRPTERTFQKYAAFGFDLPRARIVSSRDALLDFLARSQSRFKTPACRIGIADAGVELGAIPGFETTRLAPDTPDEWLRVDAIALLGTTAWDDAWQMCLKAAVRDGQTILVANPDVAAPLKDGFSREPAYWLHDCMHELKGEFKEDFKPFENVAWFGKPHRAAFEVALKRLAEITGRDDCPNHRIAPPRIAPHRIAMVGDSLHTDILGGAAMELKTVLVTGHGLFRDGGAEAAIAASGITPDYIVDTV